MPLVKCDGMEIAMRLIVTFLYFVGAMLYSYPVRLIHHLKYKDKKTEHDANFYSLKKIARKLLQLLGVKLDIQSLFFRREGERRKTVGRNLSPGVLNWLLRQMRVLFQFHSIIQRSVMNVFIVFARLV